MFCLQTSELEKVNTSCWSENVHFATFQESDIYSFKTSKALIYSGKLFCVLNLLLRHTQTDPQVQTYFIFYKNLNIALKY